MKFKNGLLFKPFNMKNVIFDTIKPTVEEIQLFKNAKENVRGGNDSDEGEWDFLNEENMKRVFFEGSPT